MTKQIFLKSGALMLAVTLGGCFGHGSTSTPATTVVTAQSFESNFGTSFAAAFDASHDGTAIDPTSSDVPALNLSGIPYDN